jgi:prephenate dehydrogenase
MSTATAERPSFRTILIAGCGLIGCSIAAALKARRFPGRIVGCGRPGANLDAALAGGHVDAIETDLSRAAAASDLIVACTPVDRIAETVRTAASACRDRTLITDVGSTKGAICRAVFSELPSQVTFIGSHPIAGSEKQGCGHADSELFVDRVCVVTPFFTTPRDAIDRLSAFWRGLGAVVVEMTPEEHDRALAQTSHVPHVVAAALAAALAAENRAFAGSGFHDTTRVASGDPGLWTSILMSNAAELAAGLGAFSERLSAFQRALEARDEAALRRLLAEAKANREAAGRPAGSDGGAGGE